MPQLIFPTTFTGVPIIEAIRAEFPESFKVSLTGSLLAKLDEIKVRIAEGEERMERSVEWVVFPWVATTDQRLEIFFRNTHDAVWARLLI